MLAAKIRYSSDTPQGLPAVFPVSLGAVRSDISDISLKYDADSKCLHILLTLAEGVDPGGENPGAAFDDLVVGLVDHASFEMEFPIGTPRLTAYNGPDGGVIVFPQPMTCASEVGGFVVVRDSDALTAKLKRLVPSSKLLQEYNAASYINNPIQQFVALWGVLTYVAGSGTVSAVDKLLNQRGVVYEPVAGLRGPETRFAKVRAEIAHPSDRGVKLSELPQRVSEVLPEFRKIARDAVASELGLL